jgi:hypothetical protein
MLAAAVILQSIQKCLSSYLSKKGQKGFVKAFRKRWFRYDDRTGLLKYFKSNTDSKPLGYCAVSQVLVMRFIARLQSVFFCCCPCSNDYLASSALIRNVLMQSHSADESHRNFNRRSIKYQSI